jgi:hypothetical protein
MLRRKVLVLVMLLWLATVAGAAAIGFLARPSNAQPAKSTGSAYVGGSVIAARLGSQGAFDLVVPLDLPWQGQDGSWRDNGRPDCLSLDHLGKIVPIEFGYLSIATPYGGAWLNRVVWVSCQV